MTSTIVRAIAALFAAGVPGVSPAAEGAPRLPVVLQGFEIEVAAEFPIVERPVVACFDERGRLFVVDSSGANEPFEKLVKNPPHRIVVIEDTDGDGKFDKRTVFVDRLVMPQGVLPYRGAVYTASPPSVWKLEDTDGDGVCDRRTEIVTEFGSNGNAADIHGPFLGPDGWLYLCDGRHGHKVKLENGKIDQGLAGGIFRFRTDGSAFERVCGGGFDNPVEIDFTEEGEILGTVNILHGNPRQDCLVHWVEGGVYPRADQEQCLAEFKRTGDLLTAIKEFGHVAVAGMTRYRSEGFGPEYRDNLFITFFNRHKVIRSILVRSGSTFTSREEEFLVSEDNDFHPTDVLEDADGSLLVINTGGWFRIGCPVSEIARPHVLGAIYRIRKKGMKKVEDPRGLALNLEKKPPTELVRYLGDPRPAVRERTIDLFSVADVRLGTKELQKLFKGSPPRTSPEERRNAIWAATRLYDAASLALAVKDARRTDAQGQRDLLRLLEPLDKCAEIRLAGLSDTSGSVGLAAAISAGTAAARSETIALYDTLGQMAVADLAPIRRASADAIARAKSGPLPGEPLDIDDDVTGFIDRRIRLVAVSSMIESIRKGTDDRILEHAVIYALVRIGDRERTLPLLTDPNPEVRRAALIALDQMDDGNLTRELVTPLLDTDHPQLRKTALAVINSHKGWATDLVGLLRGWLEEAQPTQDHLSLLRGTLLAQAGDPAIQQLIGEALAAGTTSRPIRLLLWEVIDRAPIVALPDTWLAAIQKALSGGSPAEIREVIGIVNGRNLGQFDDLLMAIAADSSTERDLRVEALAAVAARLKSLEAAQFALLTETLKLDAQPLVLIAAARGLADAPLSLAQLRELAASLPASGSLALPLLLKAFSRSGDDRVGHELVAALQMSSAVENLSAAELASILQKYPDSVQKEAAGLLKRLGGGTHEEQRSRLTELTKLLEQPGDAARGREVFFGKKAGCANCHMIGNEGGRVGPDLTKIGASRSAYDLLEAIVVPSASFAREFRPYVILTDSGKTYTGVITRQTADAIHLRTADLSEIRIPRAGIEEMKESNTSIMPKGLDAALTPEEFRNLLAFLQQLK
jgi:putative membrane-bound dehydrogenase-like protein